MPKTNSFERILPSTRLLSIDELLPVQADDDTDKKDTSSTSEDGLVSENIKDPENPATCLTQVLMYLHQQESNSLKESSWKVDVSFTIHVRELALFSPELVSGCLPSIFSQLCRLCNSLRSVVIKAALLAITDLFTSLKVASISFTEE